MKRNLRSWLLSCLGVGLLSLAATPTNVAAQEKANVPAGGEVKVTVTAGVAPPPPVSITLHERNGHVTPHKGKMAHTGSGLIDVATPAPDTVVITMTGAVVSNSDMAFEVEQCFEVNFDDPKVKKAKLTVEGRVIGLLRAHSKGCAEYADACAHVTAGPVHLVSVCVPPRSVCGCENLSVNEHDGPRAVPVLAGKYTLHQTFHISAESNCCFCYRPSAEFAPDPALDPLWISYWEPFHGIVKKDFGFQVVIKVAADEEKKEGNGKEPEKLPPPGMTLVH